MTAAGRICFQLPSLPSRTPTLSSSTSSSSSASRWSVQRKENYLADRRTCPTSSSSSLPFTSTFTSSPTVPTIPVHLKKLLRKVLQKLGLRRRNPGSGNEEEVEALDEWSYLDLDEADKEAGVVV